MVKHATWGLWYWPAFILAVLAMFVPAETYGLVTDTANTLSWFAWREFGVPVGGNSPVYNAAWYFSLAAYCAVTVFLGIHIWFVRLR